MSRCNFIGVFFLSFCFAITGCSRSPKVTFYTLDAVTKNESKPLNKQTHIVIGPITLPEIVDRPQLVLRTGANRIEILEEHRWAESLKSEIPRIMSENICSMLGLAGGVSSYLQNGGVDAEYRFWIDITRFEAIHGQRVNLSGVWSLQHIGDKSTKTVKFNLSEQLKSDSYDSIISAYDRVIYSLSEELAKEVSKELKL